MHDHLNGGRSPWPTPSPWDIFLGSLNRIERTQAEQTSRLGGLENGQRITLDAVEKLFDLSRETDGRLTAIESRPTAPLNQPPPQGLLASTTALIRALGETLPRVRDLIMALLLLAAGLGLVVDKAAERTTAAPPVASPSAP